MIADAAAGVGEAVQDLERFTADLDLEPARLDELEARKALYEELQRKYRLDVVGLLALQDSLAERIERHRAATGDLAELSAELAAARSALADQAVKLRRLRREGAPALGRRAMAMIRPLALPELELAFLVENRRDPEGQVEIDGQTCTVGPRGADRISLQVKTNRGEAPGDVGRIASGGERSRIYLGLAVLGDLENENPLRLFDEVDSGLGMDHAQGVARLLADLAVSGQVICITHLPTVAARGADHLKVTKEIVGKRTLLRVDRLDSEQRLEEIVRLLGGNEGGDGAQGVQEAYARKLLGLAAVKNAKAAGMG
jgi:DNA repair protein RecN (Recombination protein N)